MIIDVEMIDLQIRCIQWIHLEMIEIAMEIKMIALEII